MLSKNNNYFKMKTKNLLKFMHILAWLAFIGLMIKSGSNLFSYFLSLNDPEVSKNLFGEIYLYDFYTHSFWQYSFIVGYKFVFYAMEAFVALLIIKLLKNLKLNDPFNEFVATKMKQIGWAITFLWIIAMIHNFHMQFTGAKHGLAMNLISTDFIFLAFVIFIFTKIVQQGIDLKTENELTI